MNSIKEKNNTLKMNECNHSEEEQRPQCKVKFWKGREFQVQKVNGFGV